MISMIVAMDENNGIGYLNQLLCHLPADLAYFKRMTLGKPVIMGRHTYESIGKPLPGRKNIVISRQTELRIEGVCVVNSLDKALEFASAEFDVMVIGGAEIYRQALKKADCLFITRIHHLFEADTHFPELDKSRWVLKEASYRKRDDENPYDITFEVYTQDT